jgi:hypothetical protein
LGSDVVEEGLEVCWVVFLFRVKIDEWCWRVRVSSGFLGRQMEQGQFIPYCNTNSGIPSGACLFTFLTGVHRTTDAAKNATNTDDQQRILPRKVLPDSIQLWSKSSMHAYPHTTRLSNPLYLPAAYRQHIDCPVNHSNASSTRSQCIIHAVPLMCTRTSILASSYTLPPYYSPFKTTRRRARTRATDKTGF